MCRRRANPSSAVQRCHALAHLHPLLVAVGVLASVLLPVIVHGAPLPINCQVVRAAYTTRNVQLNNTVQVVSLAVYQGTAFFVDCFGYALQGDACDGSGGGPSAAVESWVLTTSVATRKELSRHPLSGDLLGASVLSTSYYYGESRYIYLQLKAATLPAGCSSVVVQYSFSAYSSVAQPPQYQDSGRSSPFFVSLSSLVLQTGFPAAVSMEVDRAAPQTFQIAVRELELSTCVDVHPSGVISYAAPTDGGAANSSAASMTWATTFAASGFYEICMRPSPSAPFLFVGVLQVFATNPAFWDISNVYHGSGVTLNDPYLVTFVGSGFDLRSGHDTAKVASLTSRSCRRAEPAGGVPLGTSLMPYGAVDSQIAIFNFTLTIEGTYYFCYEHRNRWTAVTRYSPFAINNRPLVPNVTESYGWSDDDEPVDWVSHTRTVSASINPAVPPPPTTATPTATSPRPNSTTTTAVPPSTTARISTTAAPPVPTGGSSTTLAPHTTAPTATTAMPSTTTSAPTTLVPATTTVAPGPSCDALQLPAECPLLANLHDALRLVLTVQHRVATFQSSVWRGNLSMILCVPLERVAIYEMADDVDSMTEASLVVGLLCSVEPSCSASELLSAVSCIASDAVITTDPVANATYQAQREMLRAAPLRILAVRDATSSITTANTTNHAAPSENPVLGPKDIAILSSTVAVVIAGVVAAICAVVAYRKREFLRKQLGRLGAGEVFSTAIERIPRARGDVGDEMDFDGRPDGDISGAAAFPHALAAVPPREMDGSNSPAVDGQPGAWHKDVSSLNSSQHTTLDGVALAVHLDDQWHSQGNRNPLNQERGDVFPEAWTSQPAACQAEEDAADDDGLSKPTKVVFED